MAAWRWFGGLAASAVLIVAIEADMSPVEADGLPEPVLTADTRGTEPIRPLPESVSIDPRKVSLGKRLFDDVRLSSDDTVSCASCHSPGKGFADGRARSIGVGGAEGAINAPGLFNSGFNFRQFWDGRARTLVEQVDGPVQHPREMGSTWPQVVAKLSTDPSYRSAFGSIYGGAIRPEHVKDAIAAFERSLVTPNSRFDRYLRGDRNAMTAAELEGYRHFKSYGCVACHQGMNIGGNLFQRFGILDDYFADRGNMTNADLGRYALTGRIEDLHVFRVPSLRNVAVTAPYFHDGSAQSLEEAVIVMARYQLGISMPTEDVVAIAQFLRTLTGEYKGPPL